MGPTTGRGAGSEVAQPGNHGQRRPSHLGKAATATAALLGLVLMAGACSGGPKSPGVAESGPATTANRASSGGPKSLGALAEMMAYARCMRTHGISDFPDPTRNPGGPGGSFQFSGGPGSDLNPHNPSYEAANKACQPLLPNGGAIPAPSATQLAAEVKLAACMRTHGFPAFPDPNGQGAFVLHNFDMSSPEVQSAFKTCDSLTKFKGPMRVGISNQGP
jgi:hypothetical protein